MPVVDNPPDASPSMSASTNYNYASPITAHAASPSRFEYDYGLPGSIQPTSQQWNSNGHGEDRRGLDIYPNGSPETSLYPNNYGYPSGLDTGYPGYDGSDLTMAGLGSTPPSTSFAATGLPFRGLDYIKNYNLGGYAITDQDSLWQSYDPGAFGFDPDLPFTLGDAVGELHDARHHS
jgi:hypothetical protein